MFLMKCQSLQKNVTAPLTQVEAGFSQSRSTIVRSVFLFQANNFTPVIYKSVTLIYFIASHMLLLLSLTDYVMVIKIHITHC